MAKVTKEQIAIWKKQYGGVYKYTTSDKKECYLKRAGLDILDACRTISGGSSIKFDTALVENCWLAGDEELKTVDAYRMGLYEWIGGLIKKIDGQLEEL